MRLKPQEARQGETTPRHRMAWVLVISTLLALFALAATAYIMGWRFNAEPRMEDLQEVSSVFTPEDDLFT